MSRIVTQDVEYFHEGTRMVGLCRRPAEEGGLRPGVLVVHGAFGLDDHVAAVAERLAALGYVALAVDLWGERRKLGSPAEFGPMFGRFAADRALWLGRLEAARVALCVQPDVDATRLAVVGYCFGGASALEMVRGGLPLAAAISFHGGLDVVGADWSAAHAAARVLISTGSEDPLAKPADVAAVQAGLSAAGMSWETNVYGGARHAFTEPDRPGTPPFAGYDAVADRRSWRAMTGLLEEVFAG